MKYTIKSHVNWIPDRRSISNYMLSMKSGFTHTSTVYIHFENILFAATWWPTIGYYSTNTIWNKYITNVHILLNVTVKDISHSILWWNSLLTSTFAKLTFDSKVTEFPLKSGTLFEFGKLSLWKPHIQYSYFT